MHTIKGPIVLGKKSSIPKEILGEITLPFKASNWKSKHHSELVNPAPIEEAAPIEEIIEEVSAEIEEEGEEERESWTKEELQSIAKGEGIEGLRQIGDKLGLKFRGKREGIREILKELERRSEE